MRIGPLLGLAALILQSGCSYFDDQLRFTQPSLDGGVSGYLMCSPVSLVDPFVCHRFAIAACTRLGLNMSSIRGVKSGGPKTYDLDEINTGFFYRVTHVVECAPAGDKGRKPAR